MNDPRNEPLVIPNPHSLPSDLTNALTEVVARAQLYPLAAGPTALFWHLEAILRKHLEPRPTGPSKLPPKLAPYHEGLPPDPSKPSCLD